MLQTILLILFLIAIILAIKLFIKCYGLFVTLSSLFGQQRRTTTNVKGKNSHKMVKCAKCQLYIPETEAFIEAGQSYCSKQHARESTPPASHSGR